MKPDSKPGKSTRQAPGMALLDQPSARNVLALLSPWNEKRLNLSPLVHRAGVIGVAPLFQTTG